jgi:hypothetical protein
LGALRVKLLGMAAVVAFAVGPYTAQAQRKCDAIQSRKLTLDARNDEWVSTGLHVQRGDLVLVFAAGQVTVGAFTGKVDAEGAGKKDGPGYGRVEMKVGTGTVVKTGKRWVGTFDEDSASVKLRVWDTDYHDNKGQYAVVVLVIPSGAIPEPTEVKAD